MPCSRVRVVFQIFTRCLASNLSVVCPCTVRSHSLTVRCCRPARLVSDVPTALVCAYCPRTYGVISFVAIYSTVLTYAHRSLWSIGHQRLPAIALCSGHSGPVGPLLFQLCFSVSPPTVARPASLSLPLQVPGQGLACGAGSWLPEGVSDPAPLPPQYLLGYCLPVSYQTYLPCLCALSALALMPSFVVVYSTVSHIKPFGPNCIKIDFDSDVVHCLPAAPYFKFPLRDQHLDVGRRLTLVCDAVAIPAASYTWYRDGLPLASDPDMDIEVW